MATNTGVWLAQQLMRDFGLSPGAAAGFAGNLAHESGNFRQLQEINPVVKGSRGGYGWAQWTGPRRRQFEAWSKQNGLDPSSPEANYGFLKYELTNTPEGSVLKSLEGVSDPSQAAQIVSNKFLRPGVPHMQNRVRQANQIASSLGSQIAAQPASPPQEAGSPAPAMPPPMNVPPRPVTPAQAPQPQAPASLFQTIAGKDGAEKAASAVNPMLQMLMQPQEQPEMPQMPQQPQGNPLVDYLTQYMQSRMI